MSRWGREGHARRQSKGQDIGIAVPPDVKGVGPGQMRLFCRSWLGQPWSQRSLAGVIGSALVLWALSVFTVSCLASETGATSLRYGTAPLSVQSGRVADVNGRSRFDVVTVKPEGWAPKGFRYRVVLGPTTRGAASSCELTAAEGGLLVIARDVDGIGDDLDLIIKSARSLAPVGVWINDHRGGFTKADPSLYAASLWFEVPLLVSDNPPESLHPAGLPSHPSCINPPARRFPFEHAVGEILVHSTNFAFPSRLTAGPHQTRAPPLPLSAKASAVPTLWD